MFSADSSGPLSIMFMVSSGLFLWPLGHGFKGGKPGGVCCEDSVPCKRIEIIWQYKIKTNRIKTTLNCLVHLCPICFESKENIRNFALDFKTPNAKKETLSPHFKVCHPSQMLTYVCSRGVVVWLISAHCLNPPAVKFSSSSCINSWAQRQWRLKHSALLLFWNRCKPCEPQERFALTGGTEMPHRGCESPFIHVSEFATVAR